MISSLAFFASGLSLGKFAGVETSKEGEGRLLAMRYLFKVSVSRVMVAARAIREDVDGFVISFSLAVVVEMCWMDVEVKALLKGVGIEGLVRD
jgi:hypothetical protein